jgi:hypothetical protein
MVYVGIAQYPDHAYNHRQCRFCAGCREFIAPHSKEATHWLAVGFEHLKPFFLIPCYGGAYLCLIHLTDQSTVRYVVEIYDF